MVRALKYYKLKDKTFVT